MTTRRSWSHLLVIVGLLAMIVGAVDPLEGSLIILPGSGLVALGAFLGGSRFRRTLVCAFALITLGVGAMFALSAWGGIGGQSGHSMWWGLTILPYPIGWLLGLTAGIRRLFEAFKSNSPSVAA